MSIDAPLVRTERMDMFGYQREWFGEWQSCLVFMWAISVGVVSDMT